MTKILRYLLILLYLFSACEARKHDSQTENTDTLKQTFWVKEFEFEKYSVTRAAEGYGKRLFIDSLNFRIYRGYFVGDSTKLIIEHCEDFLNDTAVYKEYYLNGRLKEISFQTLYNRIPIRKHFIYDKKGNVTKVTDYEKNLGVTVENAIQIAERQGMKEPFEIGISMDSLFWEILIWKNIEFDSTTNRGIDKGLGVAINRRDGLTQALERRRKFVY